MTRLLAVIRTRFKTDWNVGLHPDVDRFFGFPFEIFIDFLPILPYGTDRSTQ
jgi:hypothetical protein